MSELRRVYVDEYVLSTQRYSVLLSEDEPDAAAVKAVMDGTATIVVGGNTLSCPVDAYGMSVQSLNEADFECLQKCGHLDSQHDFIPTIAAFGLYNDDAENQYPNPNLTVREFVDKLRSHHSGDNFAEAFKPLFTSSWPIVKKLPQKLVEDVAGLLYHAMFCPAPREALDNVMAQELGEAYVSLAEKHAEANGSVEFTVGDLEIILREALLLLTKQQQLEVYRSAVEALCIDEDDRVVFLVRWKNRSAPTLVAAAHAIQVRVYLYGIGLLDAVASIVTQPDETCVQVPEMSSLKEEDCDIIILPDNYFDYGETEWLCEHKYRSPIPGGWKASKISIDDVWINSKLQMLGDV